MTYRSHPWAYPAENGHSSHDHNASLHRLLSERSEHLFRGRTLASSSGRLLLSGEGKRGFTDASPREEDSRIERQHAIICRGSSQWSATSRYPLSWKRCFLIGGQPNSLDDTLIVC